MIITGGGGGGLEPGHEDGQQDGHDQENTCGQRSCGTMRSYSVNFGGEFATCCCTFTTHEERNTVKTKSRFEECFIPVLDVKPKRGWYVLCLFFKIGMSLFSPIIQKVSERALY